MVAIGWGMSLFPEAQVLKDHFNHLTLVNKTDLCGAPHKLIMRISPRHLGQIRGSVSYTFWMKWDQRFFNSLDIVGGGTSFKVEIDSTKPTQTPPTYLPAWPIERKTQHRSALFRSRES